MLKIILLFHSGAHGVEKSSVESIRFFRVEKTYAVTTGKWYFEFEVMTAGEMLVGWARPACKPDAELGSDDLAYMFDGFQVTACEQQMRLTNDQIHNSINSNW